MGQYTDPHIEEKQNRVQVSRSIEMRFVRHADNRSSKSRPGLRVCEGGGMRQVRCRLTDMLCDFVLPLWWHHFEQGSTSSSILYSIEPSKLSIVGPLFGRVENPIERPTASPTPSIGILQATQELATCPPVPPSAMARQPYLEHSKTLERRFICTVRLATLDERHLSFRTLCAMLSCSCHKFGICWD